MGTPIPVSASQQSGAQFTPGPAISNIQAVGRTFSLSGIIGTTFLPGDVVDIWGSNDGGATYQPLRTAANQIIRLTFGNPEAVITDCCDHYGTQRVSVATGSALASVGFNGVATAPPKPYLAAVNFDITASFPIAGPPGTVVFTEHIGSIDGMVFVPPLIIFPGPGAVEVNFTLNQPVAHDSRLFSSTFFLETISSSDPFVGIQIVISPGLPNDVQIVFPLDPSKIPAPGSPDVRVGCVYALFCTIPP